MCNCSLKTNIYHFWIVCGFIKMNSVPFLYLHIILLFFPRTTKGIRKYLRGEKNNQINSRLWIWQLSKKKYEWAIINGFNYLNEEFEKCRFIYSFLLLLLLLFLLCSFCSIKHHTQSFSRYIRSMPNTYDNKKKPNQIKPIISTFKRVYCINKYWTLNVIVAWRTPLLHWNVLRVCEIRNVKEVCDGNGVKSLLQSIYIYIYMMITH